MAAYRGTIYDSVLIEVCGNLESQEENEETVKTASSLAAEAMSSLFSETTVSGTRLAIII